MGRALQGSLRMMPHSIPTTSAEQFFTPSELCERWKIDARTLDKFDLPWVWLTPRIRRVRVDVIFQLETSQGLR